MSRSLRRQPLVQKPPSKAPSFRPAGARPQRKGQQAASPEQKAKRTLLERIPIIGRSVQEIVNELRKVTWPTREETSRLAVAVIVVAIAIGLLLGGVDLGFNWFVENTLLRE